MLDLSIIQVQPMSKDLCLIVGNWRQADLQIWLAFILMLIICPTNEQVADMWSKKLGSVPFVVYGGHFIGIVPFLCS